MEIDRFIKKGMYYVALFFFSIALTLSASPAAFSIATAEAASGSVEIWWPTTGTTLSGTSPIKGILSNSSPSEYTMSWNVDNGKESTMSDSQAEYPHKEDSIDFSSWNWKGAGPYTITVIARTQNGAELARKSIDVYTKTTSLPSSTATSSTSSQTVPHTAPTAATEPSPAPLKNINVWWPTNNAVISGTTPLKAVIDGSPTDTYKMFWQVDGGAKTELPTNTNEWPHKEVTIDTTNWNWNSSKQYAITLTATDTGGTQIASKTISVTVTTTAVSQIVSTVTPTQPVTTSAGNPLANKTFFTGSYSPAQSQVDSWKYSRPTDAELMKKLVGIQDARWFGNWNGNIESDVRTYVSAAESAGGLPVVVAYNIPFRDCGGYSSGGSESTTNYKTWIQSFANGIGTKSAVVILEPDAIPLTDCLSATDQTARYDLLSYAVTTLKRNSNTVVYLDAGHSNWHPASTIAERLKKANIAAADGFSLNVSNYYSTPENKTFGDAVSAAVGGKHYVVDTSRNGNGSNGDWCNASGRALGSYPTAATGSALIDAFLWIKKPGESDGNCNGGPSAGAWWGEYALGLIKTSQR